MYISSPQLVWAVLIQIEVGSLSGRYEMTELVISTSGGCVHFLNMRVCYHPRSGWSIQYRKFTPIRLLMREERLFAERTTQQIGATLRFGDRILLNEQIAARLHVADALDMRQAQIENDKIVVEMTVGSYAVPVEITTLKVRNGVPFSFEIVPRDDRQPSSV